MNITRKEDAHINEVHPTKETTLVNGFLEISLDVICHCLAKFIIQKLQLALGLI